MISLGINETYLRVIHNSYRKTRSCVKKYVGVRQGENLSPLLFSIFLNDFEYFISRKYNGMSSLATDINQYLTDEDVQHFLRIFALLYADDTIVLAESSEELQLALNAVHEYCDTWKISVNTDKIKVVFFFNKEN